ncbi:DUF4910 domain-containing protein [Streptosporangium sp. NPDC049376]|uniref:DUF4910 domain-containing protein n=1 Tax=Streptosporangium sp. NPDC049376 TaxID=3366192 RepID=UPI003794993E
MSDRRPGASRQVDALIASVLGSMPTDEVIGVLERVSGHDRFQASDGLRAAAGLVAEAAEAAGLTSVGITDHPADGTARWWSFAAPMSWTPTRARADIVVAGATVLSLDQERDPFAVATYSAATAGPTEAPLVRPADVRPGAVVVVDRETYADGSLLPDLTDAGALGFVTDAPTRTGPDGVAYRGRIELGLHSGLLAFSLTPGEFAEARRAASAGGRCRVDVAVTRDASMPVVEGLLPGDDRLDEVWITAHLCHPRPSANDNASGVAALLGVATVLGRLPRRSGARPIRFLWGPEFVGTAATLHDRLGPGRTGRPPHALVNLDMVGEDQDLCAAPFVVERPPDLRPSLFGPLAEHVVDRVFAATAEEPGDWSASPFLGFSDHALLADPGIARPAVQLCHPADRFNHSAGDTLDKVSPVEMRRSVTVAAVLTALAADGGPGPVEWREIVAAWRGRELDTVAEVACAGGGEFGSGLRAYTARRIAAVESLLDRPGTPAAPSAAPRFAARRWEGPLNLRAMTEHLGADTRAELNGLVSQDKSTLSVLFHLAIRADGRRTPEQMIAETSYELRRPVPQELGRRLLAALQESGWIG